MVTAGLSSRRLTKTAMENTKVVFSLSTKMASTGMTTHSGASRQEQRFWRQDSRILMMMEQLSRKSPTMATTQPTTGFADTTAQTTQQTGRRTTLDSLSSTLATSLVKASLSVSQDPTT